MTDAASPTTNTPGASTTFRNGSTSARPARSVFVPSIFGIGDAATPAVHSTVALGILLPSATTPFSSTFSTLTSVMTLTPSFSSRLAAFCDTLLGKSRENSLAPVDQNDRLLAGSMRRNLRRSVTVTICAIDAASSTPVGPAPTSTNVIWRARSAPSSVVSASSIGAQDFCPDRLGVTQALEPRRISRKLVMAEIARPHASRDDQVIECDLADANAWTGRFDRYGKPCQRRSLPPSITLRFCCFASSCRIGAAISDGASTAVATW